MLLSDSHVAGQEAAPTLSPLIDLHSTVIAMTCRVVLIVQSHELCMLKTISLGLDSVTVRTITLCVT